MDVWMVPRLLECVVMCKKFVLSRLLRAGYQQVGSASYYSFSSMPQDEYCYCVYSTTPETGSKSLCDTVFQHVQPYIKFMLLKASLCNKHYVQKCLQRDKSYTKAVHIRFML